MTSKPGYKAIVMYILPNILRSKSNQTIKLGQLIKYDMRNIFLEKSCTKCGGETSPRPFLKNQNWAISGSLIRNVIKFVFVVC